MNHFKAIASIASTAALLLAFGSIGAMAQETEPASCAMAEDGFVGGAPCASFAARLWGDCEGCGVEASSLLGEVAPKNLPAAETLYEDLTGRPHRGNGGYSPRAGRILILARALTAADLARELVVTYTYTETTNVAQADDPYTARIVWAVPVGALAAGAVVGASGVSPSVLGLNLGAAFRYGGSGRNLQVAVRLASFADDERVGRLKVSLR